MDEFEYYLIDRDNQPNLPVFAFKNVDDGDLFLSREAILELQTLEMCLWKPKPPKPQFVDFHSASDVLAFKKKLYDILEPPKLHKVQFIPATVEEKKGVVIESCYWLMHKTILVSSVWTSKNQIVCLIIKEG